MMPEKVHATFRLKKDKTAFKSMKLAIASFNYY